MKIITKSLLSILLMILLTFLVSSCKKNDGLVTPDTYSTWTKTYSGSISDVVTVVLPFSDGYLVCGHTNSYGAGNDDGFAMQIKDNGDITWMKTYGGSGFDIIKSAALTDDDNIIMAGTTTSFNSSQIDVFAIKIDPNGNLLWSCYYKLPGIDYAYAIKQTDDGGYAIAGSTDSYGAGNSDAMLLKIDSVGSIEYVTAYGGLWNDVANTMLSFYDGGFNIAGYTFSAGSTCDIMLLSISEDGELYWVKTYGGDGVDQPNDLIITNDGIGVNGLMISGYTQSFGLTSGDAYFIKTDINGYLQWSKTLGGTGMEQSLKVIQLLDGGYVSTGFSNSSFSTGANEIFNVRLFGDGAFKWADIYGGSSNEQGNAITELPDKSLLFAGINEAAVNVYDITISKIKEDGSACGNYNPVSPTGGGPATIVLETNNITQTSVSSYETVNADVIVNSVNFITTANCNNP